MEKRNFCVIVNPMAAQAMKLAKKIELTLQNLPINFRIVFPGSIAHAQEVARQAIKQNEWIAIVGGDGSIRALASVLKEMDGIFSFIPAGRGNDLARVLNLPLDPIEACQILAYGNEKRIDMAQVNGQCYLSICSLGFDSIANKIADHAKFIKGGAVYLYAGLRTLISCKPIHFKVIVDGKSFEHVGYNVAVANSSCYGGGMYLAPQASIDDGLLDVVLVGEIPKWRMIVNMPRIFKGTHINEAGFSVLRGRQVQIEADHEFTIYADGDEISPPPAEIKILPKSLRVLVR